VARAVPQLLINGDASANGRRLSWNQRPNRLGSRGAADTRGREAAAAKKTEREAEEQAAGEDEGAHAQLWSSTMHISGLAGVGASG
jgi:hypothetical protein